jgi:hypothetical protein
MRLNEYKNTDLMSVPWWSSTLSIATMLPLKQGLLCGLGLVLLIQHGTSQNWNGPPPYPDEIAPDVIVEGGGNSAYPLSEGINTNYPTTIDGTDFYLRIMPLGASITQGVESSDDNGYRKLLRQQLRWKGWKVNMVGTKNDGTMSDNVRSLPLIS